MYPEQNSSNSQTASLSGMLFNHRRFAPWYDDRADYNTDAKSYYDYLARTNKLLDAISYLLNKVMYRDINVNSTDSIEMKQSNKWSDDNNAIQLYSNVKLTSKPHAVENALIIDSDDNGMSGGLYIPNFDKNLDGRGILVNDFGAVGDGIVDDTESIQKALNVGGKVLLHQNREYRITKPLKVMDNTQLNGQKARIIFDGGVLNDHGMIELYGSNIIIENVIFNGNIKKFINNGDIKQHTYTTTENRGVDGIRSGNNIEVSDFISRYNVFEEIQKMGIVINTNRGKNLVSEFDTFEYTNRDGSWLVGDNVFILNNFYKNTHDNAIVFDAQYGFKSHTGLTIIGNKVLPSTDIFDVENILNESFMDGIYIGQNINNKNTINDVLISNNIINSRYIGIYGDSLINVTIEGNNISTKNNSTTVSTNGIIIKKSTNGNITGNKIKTNSYCINYEDSELIDISSNNFFSNYIDVYNVKNSIINNNNFTSNSGNSNISSITNCKVMNNIFTGGVLPYYDNLTNNLFIDNYDNNNKLLNSKLIKSTILSNNTNGLSFNTSNFINYFDLNQDLVDIGPDNGNGLDIVVLILKNNTGEDINVSAHTVKNVNSFTVKSGTSNTLIFAKYDLYTCISQ